MSKPTRTVTKSRTLEELLNETPNVIPVVTRPKSKVSKPVAKPEVVATTPQQHTLPTTDVVRESNSKSSLSLTLPDMISRDRSASKVNEKTGKSPVPLDSPRSRPASPLNLPMSADEESSVSSQDEVNSVSSPESPLYKPDYEEFNPFKGPWVSKDAMSVDQYVEKLGLVLSQLIRYPMPDYLFQPNDIKFDRLGPCALYAFRINRYKSIIEVHINGALSYEILFRDFRRDMEILLAVALHLHPELKKTWLCGALVLSDQESLNDAQIREYNLHEEMWKKIREHHGESGWRHWRSVLQSDRSNPQALLQSA
jgi:hypothetical protein